MNKDYIYEHWKSTILNSDASIDVWDMNSTQYAKMEIPSPETDSSMRMVSDLGLYDHTSEILDIGCGAGRYTIAFAKNCRHATGIDLSGNMIYSAKQRAEELHINNITFHQDDWHFLDISDYHWNQKFDFTFANMTPAVQSAETFQKLLDVSRGWCFMCKPTRRTDVAENYILKQLHLPDGKRCNFDSDMMYAYDFLWLEGYSPKVDYKKENWHKEIPLSYAQDFYTSWILQRNHLSEDQIRKIPVLICDMAQNNILVQESEVTISYLYWHM